MPDLIRRRYQAFRVGPLPAAAINRVLGTELVAADVWVSKLCHRHIAEDHPADYQAIIANIVAIVREPTWVGQDARHSRNFYLVKRLPAEASTEPLLVAIGLERSVHGTYNVRSAYTIGEDDVTNRRLRGALKSMLVR